MKLKRIISLKYILPFLLFVCLSFITVVSAVIDLKESKEHVFEHANITLENMLSVSQVVINEALLTKEITFLQAYISALNNNENIKAIYLFDNNNRVIESSDGKDKGAMLRNCGVCNYCQKPIIEFDSPTLVIKEYNDYQLLGLCSIQFSNVPKRTGKLFIRYSYRDDIISNYYNLSKQLIFKVCIYALVFVFVSLVLHLVVSRRASKIIKGLNNFSIDNPDMKSDVAGNDELGQISQSICELADKVILSNEELMLQTEIANNMSEGIFLINYKNHNIIYTNPKFESIFGYKSGELIGKHVSILNSSNSNEDLESAEKIFNDIDIKGYWQGQIKNVKKDGTEFWCYGKSSIFKSKNYGEIIVSVQNDISEVISIKENLRKEQVNYRELFNNMSSGVAIYDAVDGGKDFIVKDLNKAGERLSKVIKNDVLGLPITEAFPGVIDFGLFDIFKKVWKTGRPQYHPVNLYDYGDLKGWFTNYVYKLPSGEIIAIYDDVTKDKKAESDLIKSRNSLEKLSNQLHKNLQGMVNTLAATVEYREEYTVGHSRNVADLACAIARELGYSGESIEGLKMAGMLHDIGKIAIPTSILAKKSPLTDKEFDLIKKHSKVGYDLLKDIEFNTPVARIILEHHEKIDGSGYPEGKKGDEMLAESKILAVADVVEAMTLERPYRSALGLQKALQEISSNSGILFDKEVVDTCIMLFKDRKFFFHNKDLTL